MDYFRGSLFSDKAIDQMDHIGLWNLMDQMGM